VKGKKIRSTFHPSTFVTRLKKFFHYMQKNLICFMAAIICCHFSWAQKGLKMITPSAVERIEKTLSADDMQGRKAGTTGSDKAADFISAEFKKAGLKPFQNSYLQEFSVVRNHLIDVSATVDGQPVDKSNIIPFTQQEDLSIDQTSAGYQKVWVAATDSFRTAATTYYAGKNNMVVFVDTAHAAYFRRLVRMKNAISFGNARNLVFILTPVDPATFSIHATHEINNQKIKNVVGILPGKSKKEEYVIFSAHYDHLGIGKPNANQDSIYNGANDDASGTSAVILLARYFAKKADNQRTIVFTAFTAEESGGFGSQYFSRQFDPAKVMAMFNIEMIGTDSKWGSKSAYITGYEKTDMGKILENNLAGSPFKFYPDPYPQQQLFYRSDNATLARQGVPAHTISTSKMDAEKYYHTQEDEIETLDLNNMAEIIKAIAISSKSIVAGQDSPSRVDASQLK